MLSIFKKIFKKKKKFYYDITNKIYDELKVFNIHHIKNIGDTDAFYLINKKYIHCITIFNNFICISNHINYFNIKSYNDSSFYRCVNISTEKTRFFIKIKNEEQTITEIKKYFKNEYRIQKIKEIL